MLPEELRAQKYGLFSLDFRELVWKFQESKTGTSHPLSVVPSSFRARSKHAPVPRGTL